MKNIWQVDLEEALERLAEVEAERDSTDRCLREHNDWCAHRARLAAVLALCESDPYNGFIPCMDVIAAARGESDR